jgi:hypothetical protein
MTGAALLQVEIPTDKGRSGNNVLYRWATSAAEAEGGTRTRDTGLSSSDSLT